MKQLATTLTTLLIFLLGSNAYGQIIDSSFYEWTVYEIQETELDYKKCYIVAHPVKSDSNHISRQKPYFMITRFQKNRTEEVSVSAGFEYKINSKLFLLIGKTQFQLPSKGDYAWARTKNDDINIINALLGLPVFKVRSDSAFGTYAVDEYSTKGITRAYARMKEICR